MTENQKLREAFEAYITDNGKWPNAILKAPGGQYLLLRTSVAWQDWKACAEALALPTAEQVDDINVAESFTSVTKTAAPVWELPELPEPYRALDKHLSHPILRQVLFAPGEYFSADQMRAYARAALSAGDAVDAQRYRWLMDNCNLGIKQNGVGWSLHTTACIAPDCIKDVGATIDTAMRKGQL